MRGFSPSGDIFPNDTQLNKTSIGHSGNSDVDVTVDVEVDTMPIAFAMLYSLLTSKQISDKEFELAIRRLKSWNSRGKPEGPFHFGRDMNNIVGARLLYPQDSIEGK
ncbi:hypothetical protein B1B01_25260 [Priestia filamentosa]|nr:hypothetical protein B1B01_25260 [Priestia filamentosa]